MRNLTSAEAVDLLKFGRIPADIRAVLDKLEPGQITALGSVDLGACGSPLAPAADSSILDAAARASELARKAASATDRAVIRRLGAKIVEQVGSLPPDAIQEGMKAIFDVIAEAWQFGYGCAAGDALMGKIPTRASKLPEPLPPVKATEPTASFVKMMLSYEDGRLFRFSKPIKFRDWAGNERQTNYAVVSRLVRPISKIDECVIFPTDTAGFVIGQRAFTRHGETYGQCLKAFGYKTA